MRALRRGVVFSYLAVAALPLLWLVVTSLKSEEKKDAIQRQIKFVPDPFGRPADRSVLFEASLEGYTRLNQPDYTGHGFLHYFLNSVVIGVLSTLAAVALGTFCAYGFSRFRVPGSKDWLFFILSTRFLPPLAVVVPVLVMYREFELKNTHLGLILIYTVFNLSLSVWLMKGFVDDIPRAYEEAALVDGYTRLQAFWRIIVPQCGTGMAVTAVFCMISALNEYGFAAVLNDQAAKTVPAYFAGLQGNIMGLPWPVISAGALLFVIPIVVFTVLVRKHLLRGMTFGTIKQ